MILKLTLILLTWTKIILSRNSNSHHKRKHNQIEVKKKTAFYHSPLERTKSLKEEEEEKNPFWEDSERRFSPIQSELKHAMTLDESRRVSREAKKRVGWNETAMENWYQRENDE